MQDYSILIIFLHVMSAVVWVGGMTALWFFSKQTNKELSVATRVAIRAATYKKFFTFLSPFILLLFISSLFMALGYRDNAIDANGFILDFDNLGTYKLIHTKGSIWTIMVMNMIFMIWILTKASCKLCKTRVSEDCMWLVGRYLLPINIILGLVEIFLGVFLRSSFQRMQELVSYLIKRRIIMMCIVVFLAIVALVVSYTIHISPSTYFGGKYNQSFIYALIIYKLIELPILYYLLLHRHLVALRKNSDHTERLPKLRKHAKLLLFLIPQGNTIFGIIAYRLSGSVLYFLLFSCIALITLYLIEPNDLKLTKSN